jgi:hypothetical protein
MGGSGLISRSAISYAFALPFTPFTCTAAALHRSATPISSLSEQAYDQYLRLMFREQEPELLITLPKVGDEAHTAAHSLWGGSLV